MLVEVATAGLLGDTVVFLMTRRRDLEGDAVVETVLLKSGDDDRVVAHEHLTPVHAQLTR